MVLVLDWFRSAVVSRFRYWSSHVLVILGEQLSRECKTSSILY